MQPSSRVKRLRCKDNSAGDKAGVPMEATMHGIVCVDGFCFLRASVTTLLRRQHSSAGKGQGHAKLREVNRLTDYFGEFRKEDKNT